MPTPLNLLIVEDNPNDVEMLVAALRQAGFEPTWKCIETEPDFLAGIKNLPDIIISDYAMPQFSGLRAAELLQQSGLNIPFILISGTVGEDVAVEAMKHGATDYLLKDRLVRLGSAVERALREAQERTERKRMEEALLESQALYHSLVDQLPAGVFRKDAEGRYVFVSQWFCRIKGINAEEFMGKTSEEVARSKAAQKDASGQAVKYASEGADHHRLIMKAGKPIEVIEEYTDADGRKQFVHAIKNPVINSDGKIIGTLGILFDITGRKLAEAELNRERELWRTLLDNSPDKIYFKDAKSRFIKCSQAMAVQFGVESPDALVGKMDFDFFTFEHARPAFDDEQKIIRTGKPMIGVEEREVWNDGHITWVSSTKLPWLDAAGKIIGIMGISRDVTARKEAEEALRESESLYYSLVDQMPAGVFRKDEEGRFVFVNSWFCHLNGTTPETILGKTAREFARNQMAGKQPDDSVHAMEAKMFEIGEDHHKIIMREARTIEVEEEHTGPDGTHLHLRAVKIPIFGADGKVVGSQGMLFDITGQRKLEEQFRQTQKMEAIGKLAGGVAHDFNNILAVIMMQADLLKAEGDLSPAQSELANDISAATQRATNLTRQLLLFSRKETLQLRDLDLNLSINNMTNLLRRTLGEDIHMHFKFSLQPLFIHADAGMMDQILLNLAVNSRDAMPKGGQLVVETSAVEFDETAASHSDQIRPGSFVCLAVSDNGCGIPPENLPRIFEPFFTTKEVGKGTGLGLATVFGIVQQHKGWINAYSETGRGTTFRIYLPRLTKMSEQKPEKPIPAPMRGGDETILLAEDDAFLRASVSKTLSKLGYRVLEAVNGVEALEIWKKHRDEIHLVLTDMVMPGGINGKELGERLLKENPKLKVIYASGYSAEVAGKDFPLEEGVNFLTKPFQAQKLAQTIRNRLDKPA